MEATFDNKTNLLSANIRSVVDNSVLYKITTTHNLWGRTVTLLKDTNPVGTNSPIVGVIYWRERLFEVNGHRKSISDIKRKTPGFVADQPQSRSKSPGRSRSRRSRSKSKGRDDKRGRERSRDANGRTKARDIEKEKGRRSKSRSRPDSRKKKTEPELEAKVDSTMTIIAGCTSCLAFVRRSTVLLSQIGIGEWWRSVTCTTRYWRWSAGRAEYELVYHHEQWKALINLDDDDNEKTSSPVIGPARPPHMRTRSASASFGARDSVTIYSPGRNSGFSAKSASTTTNRQQQSRHSRQSSAHFSIGTATRFSGSVSDDKTSDDEKRTSSSASNDGEEELDPEKRKEERRTAASLYVPYRNRLFHKTKPTALKMKSNALLQDEVFLLLVMIYSETKRQDSTNSSGGW
ncbi:hypothetical protein AN958_03393 [Leucoagaricus sp. SymC.cos]|nr:hypothetical protein AN958_03393 [Leucoagaricus sp. SymC.cos]